MRGCLRPPAAAAAATAAGRQLGSHALFTASISLTLRSYALPAPRIPLHPQAFVLGAAMRPQLAERLEAASPLPAAGAGALFSRRPGPSMQELAKLGGNATGQQDDGFIMPLFTARELLTLRE